MSMNRTIYLMKKSNLLLFFLLLIVSCEYKDVSKKTVTLNSGTYQGQFVRLNSLIYSPDYNVLVNVTLTFTSDKFSGASGKPRYPAICNGTYQINGQEINFENLCIWTADFDWSIILGGKYYLKIEGNKLSIFRTIGDTTDRYDLVLQQ